MTIKEDWKSYQKLSGEPMHRLDGIAGVLCAGLPIKVSEHESGYEYVIPLMLGGKAVALQYFDGHGHTRIDADKTGEVINDARIELNGSDGLIVAGDVVTGIQQHRHTGCSVHIPLILGEAEPNEKCAVVATASENYQVELAAFEFAAKNPSMVKSVVITNK